MAQRRRRSSGTEMVPLATLIEDLSLAPRRESGENGIDQIHVAELVHAREAGIVLPPIVADRASRRVVDGRHRCQCERRLQGTDGLIEVEWADYESEAELYADAVRRNATHGLPLSRLDKRRIVLTFRELGVDDGDIASALGTTVAEVTRFGVTVATVVSQRRRLSVHADTGQKVPLKGSLLRFAGQTMTAAQARASRSAPGVSYVLTVNQVADALEFGLLDLEDRRIQEALWRIAQLLPAFDTEARQAG
jgi:hypothetical protein